MKKLFVVMLGLLMMAGCSSESGKPAETAKPQPAEFVTGRVALQKLYVSARGWARDAKPFRLESKLAADSKGRDGKADLWRAGFGSVAQTSVKYFTWAGTDAPDVQSRGVNAGNEDTFSPSNASTQIFDMTFLKVDSDKAFKLAQEHGGDKILEKDPDLPVLYIVDWSRSDNKVVWHVIYGTSRDQAKFRVAVDATTGAFMRVEK